MENTWLVYEETFVRMQYGKMSNDVIARAIGRTPTEVFDKAIEFGIEVAKVAPVKEKSKYYKYEKKGYRFDKRIISLSDELVKRLGDNHTVVISLNEIAVLWETTYQQAKTHLLKMLKDQKFKFKVLRRDNLSFYEFGFKDANEDVFIPPIQYDALVQDESILKNIPNISKVKWNKRTSTIYDYIYEKIRDSNVPIRILHKDIAKDLNISMSAVKTHIDVIRNTDTCDIETVRASKGSYILNYYILKKLNDSGKYNDSLKVRNIKQIRKISGLCLECGEKLDREGVRCSTCNNKINLKKIQYKNNFVSQGVCPNCRAIMDRTGRYCTKCTQEQKEKSKERYEYRQQNGLCTKCGNIRDREGAFCLKCLTKSKK